MIEVRDHCSKATTASALSTADGPQEAANGFFPPAILVSIKALNVGWTQPWVPRTHLGTPATSSPSSQSAYRKSFHYSFFSRHIFPLWIFRLSNASTHSSLPPSQSHRVTHPICLCLGANYINSSNREMLASLLNVSFTATRTQRMSRAYQMPKTQALHI